MMKTKGIAARRKGIILILSAPSGTGKTTLIKRLLAIFPDIRLSVSYTTREPRSGEIPGRDYHFIAEELFNRMKTRGDFAEWAKVHGGFYGTLRRSLEKNVENGKEVLLDIDVQGSKKIKRLYRDAVSVFLLPPTWKELEKRLASRGTDRREVVRQRLENAQRELREITHYDYFIVNQEIQEAVNSLRSIVLAERLRVRRVQRWLNAPLHRLIPLEVKEL
jgi:guanylate kinase